MCSPSPAPLTKETPKSSLAVPVILKLLQEQEMYGYQLQQAILQRSDGRWTLDEGTLYPLLYHLEKSGLVTGEWREKSEGQERKYYRLTDKGQKLLTAPPLGTQLYEWLAKFVIKLKAWVGK